MKITNRLYAYPVLSEDKDDYIDADFAVEMNIENDLNHLRMHFCVTMDSKTIEELIGSGQAEYIIHIECSNTAYRSVHQSVVKEFSCAIPYAKLNGVVEMVALIVSRQRIDCLSSDEWNSDFDGLEFSIEKGSIIAYQNLPSLEIVKNNEQISPQESIFSVYKKLNADKMIIDMEKDKVLLGLPEENYRIYASCYNKRNLRPILNSLTVLPAMVFIIEELCQSSDISEGHDYSQYRWYRYIEKSFQNRGRDFQEYISNAEHTSLEKAQEILGMPIDKAMISIRNFVEEDEVD